MPCELGLTCKLVVLSAALRSLAEPPPPPVLLTLLPRSVWQPWLRYRPFLSSSSPWLLLTALALPLQVLLSRCCLDEELQRPTPPLASPEAKEVSSRCFLR